MILYHAALIALGPGSVILPGNWGRLIRAVVERHDFHLLIFEEVSSQSYPAKPSRMAACFACLDLPTLQHEVELCGSAVLVDCGFAGGMTSKRIGELRRVVEAV